jgi:hypothetical protein
MILSSEVVLILYALRCAADQLEEQNFPESAQRFRALAEKVKREYSDEA